MGLWRRVDVVLGPWFGAEGLRLQQHEVWQWQAVAGRSIVVTVECFGLDWRLARNESQVEAGGVGGSGWSQWDMSSCRGGRRVATTASMGASACASTGASTGA